ncbi:SDR family oxidoreductase [Haladaptatus sp. AB618]|uniref:SDR family NAD(P)-dependent oxidoreductase n=1 Tax=Haladaptatus sp. AB618 TaxID=2934173 RepID=UPI00209C585E|nr:SDR family oxidoreductase [Haladaptatus sp. AB618]MCO8253043.1 SDR family oxidoreductase [Haladaptatus sp. AB618]
MDESTAVVTGGTRGIGRQVAGALANDGATVALCGRDAEEVEASVAAIEDEGGEAVGLRADVRDEFDVERLMETAARNGTDGIDVVVANAGVYHGTPGETPLTMESYAAFDDTLRTNCRGVYAAIRESLPHLNDDARILVPTGSIGHETHAGYGSYAVSKAAAEGLVRGFSAELDVPVVGIDPGVVGTEMMGGKGRNPEDVAELFVWAATDANAEDVDGETIGLKEWRKATRE